VSLNAFIACIDSTYRQILQLPSSGAMFFKGKIRSPYIDQAVNNKWGIFNVVEHMVKERT
jgi:hypothetical protein